MPICLLALLAALACLPGRVAIGKESEGDDKKQASTAADGAKKAPEPEKPSITYGSATIGDRAIEYTATAGKMEMKTDAGKSKAQMFYVAYTLGGEGAEIDASRPVTFCFNGGPGSSSVWLHMGMLGPMRVRMPDDASQPRPPFGIEPNPHSLLDVTDLVFIDPVSTGYSRPAEGEDKKQFHGYQEDLRSVGQFIHDYTSQHQRWRSPKFVLGESYGGLRAAGLSGMLQDRYNLYLNGVVLVSAVVDFSTLAFAPNNDLPYVLFLPGYTATAHYHKALSEELLKRPVADVVAEAEEFAYGPYADALLQATSMPEEQRRRICRQMARLTGLSEEYLWDANLRVSMSRFGKELLRERGQIVGRFDGRYTGEDSEDIGEHTGFDPSGAAAFGIFTSGMNTYLRGTLKYEDDRVYEILTSDVRPWNYDPFENRYVEAATALREAMSVNPYLKVFAACGYYDLATPQFAMQHSRDHLLLDESLQKNFTTKFYEGGHMMYIYDPALKQLREDLLQFYQDATPQGASPQEPAP
ncbi:S10 family peptidase [Posidoniimonas polymericola]|nr:peptidase S10 [Posidoniimonas polymericola]